MWERSCSWFISFLTELSDALPFQVSLLVWKAAVPRFRRLPWNAVSKLSLPQARRSYFTLSYYVKKCPNPSKTSQWPKIQLCNNNHLVSAATEVLQAGRWAVIWEHEKRGGKWEKRRRWGLGIWRKEGKGEKEKKKGIKSNKKKVFHESVPWHRLMPFWNGHCLHMDSLRSWSQDKHHSAKNWCEKWRQGRRAVIQDWGGGCQSKMLPNQLPQWGSWSLGFVWKTHMRVIPPEGEGDGPFITPVYGDHCLIAAPMGS